MRFLDPLPCQCGRCGGHTAQPVKKLLALTATCPGCGAGFQAAGLEMRKAVDEVNNFFWATELLMEMEADLGFKFDDKIYTDMRPEEEWSLDEVVSAARQCGARGTPDDLAQAVIKAVRGKFPEAPEVLDFNLLVVDAIKPRRWDK